LICVRYRPNPMTLSDCEILQTGWHPCCFLNLAIRMDSLTYHKAKTRTETSIPMLETENSIPKLWSWTRVGRCTKTRDRPEMYYLLTRLRSGKLRGWDQRSFHIWEERTFKKARVWQLSSRNHRQRRQQDPRGDARECLGFLNWECASYLCDLLDFPKWCPV